MLLDGRMSALRAALVLLCFQVEMVLFATTCWCVKLKCAKMDVSC